MPIKKKLQSKLDRFLPRLLVVGGFFGLLASFMLTMDKITLLENPGKELICNINPVVACGSVIMTPQASALHFPNPFLGLIGFAVVITVGMSMLAGANIVKKWYWQTYMAATALGIAFIHWLMFQSIYRIGALCPYCMLVWVVTIPIFWYSLLWTVRKGFLSVPKKWDTAVAFANRNHMGILVSWYLIIVGVILNRFWYFFGF